MLWQRPAQRWTELLLRYPAIARQHFSTDNAATRAFRPGAPPPQVVDFQITLDDAIRRFESYQAQRTRYFHATGILRGADVAWEAALLPFWAFTAALRVDCKAKLGFAADRNNPRSQVAWQEMNELRTLAQRIDFSNDSPQTLVCASYRYRREVGEAAAALPRPWRELSRQMKVSEAESLVAEPAAAALSVVDAGSGRPVAVHPPAMRQAIAWTLALRSLRKDLEARAEEMLKSQTGASHIADIELDIHVLDSHAQLVFLPAFLFSYSYGVRYLPGGTTVAPERFVAAVGGTAGAAVFASPHVSPLKAQAAAAAAVLAVGAAGVAVGAWHPGDPLFWAFVASSLTGLAARRAPQRARNRHAKEQVALDELFHRRFGAGQAVAKDDVADERCQELWCEADWRRWRCEDPWEWNEARRQRWAEDLFSQQAYRRLERKRFVERLNLTKEQQAADAEREAARQRRFGSSHGAAFHRAGDHGAAGRRRKRDFLGYYQTLGIDTASADEEAFSADAIKSAFMKMAMELHPDKNLEADEVTKRRHADRFLRAQRAYETLRDPEKRKAYDRGQLVH